jgi:transcriptional regulator with XRE-family HTH domain
MRSCTECQSRDLRSVQIRHVAAVGTLEFPGKVPAQRCASCGMVFYDGVAFVAFDREVARKLALAGVATGHALKFMRKMLGMRGAELASLLRLTPEAISRMETGRTPADLRTVALLGAMVLEDLRGHHATRARLEAMARVEAVREQRIESYRHQIKRLSPGPDRDRHEAALRDWLTLGPHRRESLAALYMAAND